MSIMLIQFGFLSLESGCMNRFKSVPTSFWLYEINSILKAANMDKQPSDPLRIVNSYTL